MFRERNPLYDEDSLPPLGLGYIATSLQRAGVRVQLIDAIADRIPLAELLRRVTALKPRILAINVFTTNYGLVKELVENLSGVCEHVIVGALSTRTLYPEIFKWTFEGQLDVVLGDGECITVDLVTQSAREAPAEQLPRRRFFKVDGQSRYYVREEDMSDLPLDRGFFSNEPVKHPRGFLEAHIVASRGCIYNCAFCAAARSLNRDIPVRRRSVDGLKRELLEIQLKYPAVRSIRVLDDLFLQRASCLAKAAEVFEEFPFQWRAMAHVLTFDNASPAELARLKESGCAELFVGIESGSERVLRRIHKTHDIGKIQANLERAMEGGISLKGYFIYGFPQETREDFEKTYQLALSLKRASVRYGVGFRTSVFQFRPYHGTELHAALAAYGVASEAVLQVEPNAELSRLVGRLQFNFHSGEYSAESSEIVREYIYKTANLTDPTQWGFRAENDVAGVQEVRSVQEPAAVGATPKRSV